MKKPIGFVNQEEEENNTPANNDSNEELRFMEWINNTYTMVDEMAKSIIVTTDIAELAEMNGFYFHKHQINKMLMENGVKKFDIPNQVDKIWLLEENVTS